MRYRLGFALLISMMPTALIAQPRAAGVHLRPQLYHDRAPRIHDRSARPHINSFSNRS